MLTRQALDTELARIDARMPLLMRDVDQFDWELADLHDALVAQCDPRDHAYIGAELSRICWLHGVSPPGSAGADAAARRAA